MTLTEDEIRIAKAQIQLRNVANYIMMCYTAKDIQSSWKPELNDNICKIRDLETNITPKIFKICTEPIFTGELDPKPTVIWIPTIEQLFEIYWRHQDSMFAVFLIQKLYYYVDTNTTKNHGLVYPSMEEMVLVFIMECIYNKKLVAKRDFHTRKIMSAEWVSIDE
jgi:hypothetical protein